MKRLVPRTLLGASWTGISNSLSRRITWINVISYLIDPKHHNSSQRTLISALPSVLQPCFQLAKRPGVELLARVLELVIGTLGFPATKVA